MNSVYASGVNTLIYVRCANEVMKYGRIEESGSVCLSKLRDEEKQG